MIYLIKTIMIICSIVLISKAIIKEDFNCLYDGTIIGLLGILIKPL